MSPREILDLPMQPNDSNATTVRGYLIALLLTLWSEGEGFSGKRPFGNSGWEFDLYYPLIKAGLVPGRVEDGLVEEINKKGRDQAEFLIREAIKQLS